MGTFGPHGGAIECDYPSPHHKLALGLTKQEGCPLQTGDQQRRAAAAGENLLVMGTLWLLRLMVEHRILDVDAALAALDLMKERKRRLPWSEAVQVLNALREIR